jgi:cellulose synthase/poly-beta-1,6-N-acetylglucosamine synthase-like glycosyltransferase
VTALLTSILWLLALPAVVSCAYLLLLTLLSKKMRLPAATTRALRFDVIVPAHDEEILIARTVDNLLRMDWPTERFRVVVVADNCADKTAALARAAGARVLERRHDSLRGKGYALEHAFRDSLAVGWADAVLIIDADREVSSNLLTACAARLENGAHAVQVHYGVLEPRTSWRTRLLCIAMTAFHRVRSRGRERLKVSCGFRGNGWCVTHALLKSVPYQAFSLAEDIEYGIELGLAGHRIHYADEASVDAEMVADAAAAGTQRQRWEHGRFELIRTKTAALLRAAVRQRSAVCLDLAADLMVLPLSYVALNVAALLASAAALLVWQPAATHWLWLALACAGSLTLYVLRGWQLSGMGLLGLLDLARAPFFVAWKVLLMLQPRASLSWVRTRRRAQ